jgi:ParB-like nuclease domain
VNYRRDKQMSEIVEVKISSIDPNPMRMLTEYPYNPTKIAALRRSIAGVGLWEGIIARKSGRRYEIAFGHHRKEAARQEIGDDAKISLIVRDLTDEEMLQFMGRENLEDYAADFIVMLESWEAAANFRALSRENPETLEIASILGWTLERSDGPRASHTALACANAASLIADGYIKKASLVGLNVHQVEDICGQVKRRHSDLDKIVKQGRNTPAEATRAKKQYAKAAEHVAKQTSAGEVAQKEIRSAIDRVSYKRDIQAQRQPMLLSKFGTRFADDLDRVLNNDAASEKLNELFTMLPQIELDEDKAAVRAVAFRCGEIGERGVSWEKKLSNPGNKVVKLKEIK